MPLHEVHTIEIGHIPEQVVPGKRLGRHIRHDSRNRRYAHQRKGPVALRDVLWDRHIPILSQGEVGSCTGESETGDLATEPVWSALTPTQQQTLGQDFAYSLYSAAETLDGDGPYPPNDNGSSGPSVCQAALNLGLIAGYTHCFSVTDVLDALMNGAVILGTNWYDSFDTLAPGGQLIISSNASVRGGHETLWRGYDLEGQLLLGDNSWGPAWGLQGSMKMPLATLERLLAEQGDATVSIPRGQPVPATPVAA